MQDLLINLARLNPAEKQRDLMQAALRLFSPVSGGGRMEFER